VGGVAGVALSTAFILWYFRRRRRLAEPQLSAFDPPEPNSFVNFYVREITCWQFFYFFSPRPLCSSLTKFMLGPIRPEHVPKAVRYVLDDRDPNHLKC